MSMQVKRGTTESWSLGPELIKFDEFDVNGKDSTIHCEGKTMTMYVGTDSASDFDGDGEKTKGLWIVKNGEADLTPGTYRIFISTSSEVAGSSNWGATIKIGTATVHSASGINSAGTTITREVTSTSPLTAYVSWPSFEGQPLPIKIVLSVKKVGEYESLLPGQIGCEYLSNGNIAMKIGPNSDDENGTKWNEIPYVEHILSPNQYGDTLPSYGIPGRIFYKKV